APGAVTDAAPAPNTPAFPLACPECGRASPGEHSLRIGTRKARRPLVAAGAAVAILALSLGGSVGYMRWSNTRPVTLMPLWLLLRQAERDSDANQWVHQMELVRRAEAGDIAGRDAQRVIERILAW